MRTHKLGFTLAEMLVAMVFLAIVIPVTLKGIMIANHASLAAERKLNAAQLGENLLNELIITEQWKYSPTQGRFDGQWQDYEWELLRENWVEDEMQLVTIIVTYPVQQNTYSVKISTLLDETEYEEVEEAAA
jgi:type II secretory pathway pseudopilin PulG